MNRRMAKREVNLPAAQEAAKALLFAIGYNTEADPDMQDTPLRMAKALIEMTHGEDSDPSEHLAKQFSAEGYDETVALEGITFTSLCEHHILPFSGTVGVAYLTSDSKEARITGLSKLARVVEGYARRLQTQERMTRQIADAFEQRLHTRGVAVVVQASHSCMACRGVMKAGATMKTVVLRGAYRSDAGARAEVLSLLIGSTK